MKRTATILAARGVGLCFILAMGCTGAVTSSGGVGSGGGGGAPKSSGSASGGAGPVDPGIIDQPGSGSAGGTPGGLGGGGTGPAATSCVPGALPATTRLFRLTHAQYDNTVSTLTGLDLKPSADFPADQNQAGFDRGMDLEVGDALGKAYRAAAEAIAAEVVASPAALQKVVGCAASAGNACATSYIASFGRRLYRRPLTDAEKTAMMTLFSQGAALVDGAGSAFQKGVQITLEAFLQSPKFLYRTELGTQQAGGLVVLDAYERASRLSYFIQNGPPDDMLSAKADAGQLASADDVAAEARRLVGTTPAHETVRDFHHQWLNMDIYANKLTKDATAYPTVTPDLAPTLAGETEKFVDDVVFSLAKGFPSLMTAPFTYVNQTTAPIYGVTGNFGAALQRVDLDPTQRAGLLTQLGFLASNAYSNRSSPIHRGVFVQRRVLCGTIPDPPPNVPQLPPLAATQTTRQEVDMHTAPDACSGCHHAIINPVGFGFENYDAVGGYRTTENGFPIDATGTLAGTTEAAAGRGAFSNAIEESALIAASPEAAACYAKTWVRYAFGRPESAGDTCAIAVVGGNLASDDYKVTDLMVDLTRTRAFLYRAPGGN
jgi:hypothetical protein